MDGPIISIDISKDNSHMQGFESINKKFTKVIKFNHDKEGLETLLSIHSSMEAAFNQKVPVIFEATGVYDSVISKFLHDNDITHYKISPLRAAKFRQTELHANKTDKLDPKHIARVYYNTEKDLYEKEVKDPLYQNLLTLSRNYESYMIQFRQSKVRFNNFLDELFPMFKAKLGKSVDVYIEVIMELLKKYPHPELMAKADEKHTIKLTKKVKHRKGYVENKIRKLKEISLTMYSAIDINDKVYREQFIMVIEDIQRIDQILNNLLEQMIALAKQTPYFESVESIVGVGENLAARIIAEIGDISKIESKKQLASLAGLDPMIRESGQVDGKGLSITKKGNKYLRCLLYTAAMCNYRLKKGDPIYLFNAKKRQQDKPLKNKQAHIAAAHKLLAVIYGMCNNGTLYSY